MHRATFPIRSLVVVTGLALAGCGSGENKEATAPPTPTVGVAEVVSRDITPSTTFNGRVIAVDMVELRARIAGFLDKMNFTEGGEVREGDLLFGIEQQQYRAAVLQAQGAVQQAQAALVDAQLQLDRGLELVRNRNIPQSEVDSRRRGATDAQGQLTQAQAQLMQAEINLGYTEIKAPIAGRIGAKAYIGRQLRRPVERHARHHRQPGPDLRDLPGERARAARGEQERRAAGPGSEQGPGQARLPDGSLYPQTGTINFVDVQVSQSTDTVTVRATFANPKRDPDRRAVGRRRGRVGRAAAGAPRAAGRPAGRSGRALRADRRRVGQGRAAPDQARATVRAPTSWSPRASRPASG